MPESAAYPSGLQRELPEPDDGTAWPQLLDLALDDQPLGTLAPCLNPECDQPVTFDHQGRSGTLYCSHSCRSRTSRLRALATQQLAAVDAALGPQGRYRRGVPRTELRDRARHLRWWLARLTPPDQSPGRSHHPR